MKGHIEQNKLNVLCMEWLILKKNIEIEKNKWKDFGAFKNEKHNEQNKSKGLKKHLKMKGHVDQYKRKVFALSDIKVQIEQYKWKV